MFGFQVMEKLCIVAFVSHCDVQLVQVLFSVELQHLLQAYLTEKFFARLNDSRRYAVGVLSLFLILPQIKALSQLSCQTPTEQ